MSGTDAALGFAVAFVVVAALTPLSARLALRVGAIDRGAPRGLGREATPRLGGLAIFAGVAGRRARRPRLLGTHGRGCRASSAGAVIIALVGALDDASSCRPASSSPARSSPRHPGGLRRARSRTSRCRCSARGLGDPGAPLTVVGIVLIMNVVNFSDGIDGLAAGVCAIAAARSRSSRSTSTARHAGVLAALVAGAAAGFLVYNFRPARVYMGDCGLEPPRPAAGLRRGRGRA